MNLGILAGEGEYVVLLNNDTRCHELFLKSLWERMEEDRTGRLFSASACMLDWQDETLLDGAGDNYMLFGWPYARGKGRKASAYDKPVRIFSACGGAAIYRRSVLEEIGLFDENHFAYLEDVDIGYRANIAGYDNCYEPKAMVVVPPAPGIIPGKLQLWQKTVCIWSIKTCRFCNGLSMPRFYFLESSSSGCSSVKKGWEENT